MTERREGSEERNMGKGRSETEWRIPGRHAPEMELKWEDVGDGGFSLQVNTGS